MDKDILEIKEILEKNGKSFSDIIWVGTKDGYTDFNEFINFKNNKPSDDDLDFLDLPCIDDEDFFITGDNWWIEYRSRCCCWGEWSFKQYPIKPTNIINLKNFR